MKVTFPHFGPLSLALSGFFSSLGVSFVTPPYNGKRVLKKGAEISPEEMCLPFKYMAGNLKAAYEAGADTVVMAATCGPCRLGEYGQLLMEVLRKNGCDYRWVLLDAPSVIGLKEFVSRLRFLIGKQEHSVLQIAISGLCSLHLLFQIDRFWAEAEWRTGFLEEPYRCVRLLRDTEIELRAAGSFDERFRIIRKAHKRLRTFPVAEKADPVRILVTGEIYTSVEQEANGRLEEKLMKLGCSVERHITISWWIKHMVSRMFLPVFAEKWFFGSRGKGMDCDIGGYGRQSVSKILRSKNCDGIIKIMPAGCMPEIVTKAFCEKLQTDQDIRILHLVYDEMEGEAGYETRIEAFIDMLERRKNVLARSGHRLHQHGFRSGGRAE